MRSCPARRVASRFSKAQDYAHLALLRPGCGTTGWGILIWQAFSTVEYLSFDLAAMLHKQQRGWRAQQTLLIQPAPVEQLVHVRLVGSCRARRSSSSLDAQLFSPSIYSRRPSAVLT
jgi:hypothetical protein